MTSHRARRLVAPILFVLALASACTKTPPNLSPAGQAAFKADQIVLRVNELERAAIQANATGGLDLKTTGLVVKFCVDADKTLKAVPAGWQATVAAGWTALKRDIPTPTNPVVAAAFSAVDIAIATLGGR